MVSFFFFNDTATTEIYTLSLHDALPISNTSSNVGQKGSAVVRLGPAHQVAVVERAANMRAGQDLGGNTSNVGQTLAGARDGQDRKSTRLNSSHSSISYAVFCLKKKKKKK